MFGLGDLAKAIKNLEDYSEWYDEQPLSEQIKIDRQSVIDYKRAEIQSAEFNRLVRAGVVPYTARDLADSLAKSATITVTEDDIKPFHFSKRSLDEWGPKWAGVFKQ